MKIKSLTKILSDKEQGRRNISTRERERERYKHNYSDESEQELKRAIQKMRRGNAKRHDCITVEMIKAIRIPKFYSTC